MKLIVLINRKILYSAFIILMIINCNLCSYKLLGKLSPNKSVNDNSSIYTAEDAVTLLISIAKKICTKATSATVTTGDFDNIITDCLNNIRNQALTFDNNLKNFWNICTNYCKTKTEDAKKKIDQNMIEGLIALVKNNRVSIGKNQGSSCNNMLVVGNFNQQTVISEVVRFFSKFNLSSKPHGNMISSAIGVHRNLADPNFFAKLNGNKNPAAPTPNANQKTIPKF